MKSFKIESQSQFILEIVRALKYNGSGIGLRNIYDVKIERPHKITFYAKEGKEINPRDFFYLGLDINL